MDEISTPLRPQKCLDWRVALMKTPCQYSIGKIYGLMVYSMEMI